MSARAGDAPQKSCRSDHRIGAGKFGNYTAHGFDNTPVTVSASFPHCTFYTDPTTTDPAKEQYNLTPAADVPNVNFWGDCVPPTATTTPTVTPSQTETPGAVPSNTATNTATNTTMLPKTTSMINA